LSVTKIVNTPLGYEPPKGNPGTAWSIAGLALVLVQTFILTGGYVSVWRAVHGRNARLSMALGWQHYAFGGAAIVCIGVALWLGSRRFALVVLFLALLAIAATMVLDTVTWGTPLPQ
jgi:hypothetical protein